MASEGQMSTSDIILYSFFGYFFDIPNCGNGSGSGLLAES